MLSATAIWGAAKIIVRKSIDGTAAVFNHPKKGFIFSQRPTLRSPLSHYGRPIGDITRIDKETLFLADQIDALQRLPIGERQQEVIVIVVYQHIRRPASRLEKIHRYERKRVIDIDGRVVLPGHIETIGCAVHFYETDPYTGVDPFYDGKGGG